MRHAWTVAALAAGGLLAAGAAAPATMAADDCPNAAVRAQQQSQHLPNCMAYERVSPDDKNGATPNAEAITDDGGRVLFSMNSGTADPLSFIVGRYGASRTANGWTTGALMPPLNVKLPTLSVGPTPNAGWSSDLERVLLNTLYPLVENDKGVAANGNGSRDVYLREADGSLRWIVPDPGAVDTSTLAVEVMRGSADLDRIVVTTARAFDPRVTTSNIQHIYVWGPDGMQLASVLPDGSLPASLPVTAGLRGVSADGRTIAFTVGTGAAARIYVRFNADDPATAVTREVAVGANGEACTSASLRGLSDDGTKVMFWCANTLVSGAPADATYIRDLDGGAAAVRSIGKVGGSPSASIVAATPDFSRVYMRGTPIGAFTANAIYLVRDNEPIETVATPLSGSSAINTSYGSRGGGYFAFQSGNDHGFNSGSPGTSQVYRYALETGELTCVSCRMDGAPTVGGAMLDMGIANAAGGVKSSNPVTDAGTVAFGSVAGLDPRDTNGVTDAYAWIDGQQVLMSDGRNREPSTSMGGTPDGRSFLVATPASLAADDDDGSAYDLYLARPDGGFLVPDAAAVCTANCQDPSPERPSVPGMGSTDFVGRGNLLEQATAPAKRATVSLTTAAKLKGSRVTVRVKVSGVGSIRVSGIGLRQTTVKTKKAGTSSVTVRLSAYGLAQQRKRGRLATRATVRFTPASGASVKAGRSLTVAAAKKKGGR